MSGNWRRSLKIQVKRNEKLVTLMVHPDLAEFAQ